MTEPNMIGVTLVPFAEREAAIRAKFQAFGFSGPTAFDRERDHVIGFLIDKLDALREERDADARAVSLVLDGEDHSLTDLRARFADRVAAIDAADALAGGCDVNGDPIWSEQ